MFAALVGYFRQFLSSLIPMSLGSVPFTVLIAYLRHLLPALPVSNRFASKRSVLVRKVITLIASLAPFLKRLDRNLFFFCTQKREGGNKAKRDYFFHIQALGATKKPASPVEPPNIAQFLHGTKWFPKTVEKLFNIRFIPRCLYFPTRFTRYTSI